MTDDRRLSSSACSLPENDADRSAPKVELTSLDGEVRQVRLAQGAEVAHITTDADVIVEEPHRANAGVESEFVSRRIGDERAAHVRANEAETRRYVRAEPRAVRAADRNTDDDVTHCGHRIVVDRFTEEIRGVTE